MMSKKGYTSIDDYIRSFPEHIQKKLAQMRKAIREVAPSAQEKISYQMPTFYLNGNLVHFAAYTNHIGFYPTPSGISQFQRELSRYKNAKGSVQFPLEEPLPIGLIQKIVEFRAAENAGKTRKGR
jgi:uncharacterized protein YdhG (YjbR/CyaY superfamily)